MCSFEVYYVDVAQKLREWEGCLFSKDCNNCPPPILSIFELDQHNISQNFYRHHFPKDSDSAQKSGKKIILEFTT